MFLILLVENIVNRRSKQECRVECVGAALQSAGLVADGMNGQALSELYSSLVDDVIDSVQTEWKESGTMGDVALEALETLRVQWKRRLVDEVNEQGALGVVVYQPDPRTGSCNHQKSDPFQSVYDALRMRDPQERKRLNVVAAAARRRDADRGGSHRTSQASRDENSPTNDGVDADDDVHVVSETLDALSDDDDEEISAVAGDAEPETRNYILSQYERVLAPSTNKQRVWRIFLRDAMMHVNGQDMLLNHLQCTFDW